MLSTVPETVTAPPRPEIRMVPLLETLARLIGPLNDDIVTPAPAPVRTFVRGPVTVTPKPPVPLPKVTAPPAAVIMETEIVFEAAFTVTAAELFEISELS